MLVGLEGVSGGVDEWMRDGNGPAGLDAAKIQANDFCGGILALGPD